MEASRAMGITEVSEAPQTTDALFRTINDSAAMLGVSRTTIYKLLDEGELTSVKIGKARRIPSDCLAAYIESLYASATNGLAE